jgi:hypothetical protein
MPKIKQTILSYNLTEKLPTSYGRKLRGFFANKFDDVLFHNHQKSNYRYKYPLIQYKIIDGKPTVMGLDKGSILLVNNFLEIENIYLGDKLYKKPKGEINIKEFDFKLTNAFYNYKFITPWRGLNDSNYQKYKKLKENETKKTEFLSSILIGNILSFAKVIDWWIEEEIKVETNLKEVPIYYKGNKMPGFKGEFKTNIKLPDIIGLGKSPSRGFGTIKKV